MFVAAGVLLGVGLGGFVDGIVLHQILQWHHMLTAEGSFPPTSVDGLKDNTLWDGLFHAFTWLATATGLALLWNSVPVHRRGWGQVLVGCSRSAGACSTSSKGSSTTRSWASTTYATTSRTSSPGTWRSWASARR